MSNFDFPVIDVARRMTVIKAQQQVVMHFGRDKDALTSHHHKGTFAFEDGNGITVCYPKWIDTKPNNMPDDKPNSIWRPTVNYIRSLGFEAFEDNDEIKVIYTDNPILDLDFNRAHLLQCDGW